MSGRRSLALRPLRPSDAEPLAAAFRGSALMDEAEADARRTSDVVGLRVGLHSGYEAAQRLYVRRGYLPDGAGAILDGRSVSEGAQIRLDDDVTLRMTKRLR